MQPTEARDVGDALDDRPVPAVWPRPTHVGNEKYLAGFWIIEAFDLDVALKLATEGSKAGNRKVEMRRNAAKAAGRTYGRRRCPAMASTSRIVLSRRTRKSSKEILEAVSDRGRGVRSRGERPAREGRPEPQEMIRDAVPGFRDRRHGRPRHPGRDGGDRRVQRPAQGGGPVGVRRWPRGAQCGHRHRQPRRGGDVHRRALPGVEGVSRRLLDHGGPRPRRGAQARRRGVEGLQPEDRGPAVPVSLAGVREAITQAHYEEWARVVATLTRRFGDLDIAEEAAAEAFATAVGRWPADGVPPNPGAWLTTTANRKAIDRIRRENKRDDKQNEAQMLYDGAPPEPLGAIDDDRLRLIFTCCHPALAMETRVALTLRMVGGLTMPEIARAFLVQEAAMCQRITRAKAKIKAARIPYRVPSADDLPVRVSGVLAVLFLVFNEGYLATDPGTDPVRHDLIAEAIRLTRLIRALMPDDGEVAGLLALMLLTEARRTARVSAGGEPVALDEQDRGV